MIINQFTHSGCYRVNSEVKKRRKFKLQPQQQLFIKIMPIITIKKSLQANYHSRNAYRISADVKGTNARNYIKLIDKKSDSISDV